MDDIVNDIGRHGETYCLLKAFTWWAFKGLLNKQHEIPFFE